MSRPDQHPRLIAMGIGEPTCEVCTLQLFPAAPDSICDDCTLNPLKQDEATRNAFVEDAMRREERPFPGSVVVFVFGRLQQESGDK